MTSTPPPTYSEPSSVPAFRKIVTYGSYLALGIAVIGGILGGIFAGTPGIVSVLIGTVMSVVFMGVTAGSLLIANRYAGKQAAIGAFFAIVLGGWLLKFIVFLVLVFVLKDQSWLNNVVLFLSIIAGVVGSLVVDVIVLAKSRVPYVSDVTLPQAPTEH